MLFPPYEGDPAQLPALTLAYIGDGVYELFVRRRMLENEGIKAHNLHRQAIKRVNAQAQANLLKKLKDELNEEEEAIARRGRNAKSGQIPKNANVGEYRLATGLEALVGYLFLKGQWERIEELLARIEEKEED
ncbi:MAG: ribonuclease III [Clostridia bacterium]|jgi:ribonuclease-3 family protein|nr:ribonuclease III [Clostridia bacterium]